MAELVLLSIFVLGLFIAWTIVAEKTRVNFSSSIRLNHSGLSAAIPQGEGWAGLDRWEYNGDFNLYFLTSELRISTQPEVYVEWQYLLAETPGDIPEKLKHAAVRQNCSIIEEGQISKDDLDFTWIKFAQASIDKEGYLAIAELPSGRYLKLLIRTEAQSPALKPIFETAIASAEYESNDLLEESSNFVVYLKSLGAGSMTKSLLGEGMENMYTISRILPNNQGISQAGFYVERFEDRYDNGEWTGISAKQLYYFGGQRPSIEESDFVCDNDFTQFTWDNSLQTANARARIKSSIESDSAGQMTLTKSNSKSDYHLSNIVIPEVLIESVVKAFLQYDADRVLVEILTNTGQIIPTVLSKRTNKKTTLDDNLFSQKPSYTIKLQYLHKNNTLQYYYFDGDKNIMIKHFITDQQEIIFQTTNWADLIMKFNKFSATFDAIFPERGDQKI